MPPEAKNMHSGSGRISRLRMHTMSLFESGASSGDISLKDLFQGKKGKFSENNLSVEQIAFILTRGGWPEAIGEKNQQYALNMVYNYLDSLAHQNMSQIDGVKRNPDWVYTLLRSIARNISTQVNTQTLIRDIATNDEEISEKTINQYLNALKNLYVIEDLPAWRPNLRSKRAIRTTAKRHFTDPSIATAALRANSAKILSDIKTFGFLFESLCIRDLRIYAESLDGSLYHYRDQLGVEVDAIIQLRDERWAAVEIKLGAGEIEKGAENLIAFSQNIDTKKTLAPSFLMVMTGTKYAFQLENGVWVVPIGCLRN